MWANFGEFSPKTAVAFWVGIRYPIGQQLKTAVVSATNTRNGLTNNPMERAKGCKV